jgi:hypothetical protein
VSDEGRTSLFSCPRCGRLFPVPWGPCGCEPRRRAANARAGARTIYRDRWSLRNTLWRNRRWKGVRNMILPRLTFHAIYARKFGLRRWWSA